MTRWLKIHLVVWGILIAVVSAGAFVIGLTSVKPVAVELSPNASVEISAFRPLPHKVHLFFRFNTTAGKRVELGEYRTTSRSGWDAGFLEFPDPGTPIKISVRSDDGRTRIYEALPASGFSETSINRELVPFVDDGSPNRFEWPPHWGLAASLRPGFSSFNVTILEAGPLLVGESVAVIVDPPISFKSAAPGYEFLWWFMFSPVYAMVLLVYGGILLTWTFHKRRQKAQR